MAPVSTLLRAMRNPGVALLHLRALMKGYFYKVWLPLRGVQFSAGRNFRVSGALKVRGPGRVVFGDNVTVDMLVTPYTHSPDAVIRVGNHCFLNGARFGCRELIDVGDDCILADARLMDTNFHSTRADRHSPAAPIRTRPIILARNVWVGAQDGILPGTTIGENSVVGFGAVCSGAYPANVLIAGNPAVVVRPIEPTPGYDGTLAAAERAEVHVPPR